MKYNQFNKHLLSSIGFGTFRLKNPKALVYALKNGINVIDTSSHFDFGKTETLVGSVLKDFDRESLFLISKSGFTTSTNGKIIKLNSELNYSLDPKNIELDISNSLSKLNTSYMDMYMLNCPERVFSKLGIHFMEDMLNAFVHLTKEVEQGRIKSFGLCSQSIHDPTMDNHISVPHLIHELDRIGIRKYFNMIQFPFNLFERHSKSSCDGQSLYDFARENGIYSLSQRPLYAITRQKIRLLVTGSHLLNQEQDMTRELAFHLNAFAQHELALKDSNYISKFIWANVLSENLSRLVENEFATRYYLEKQVIPALESDLSCIESDPTLMSWSQTYKQHAIKVTELIIKLSKIASEKENQELLGVLKGICDSGDHSLSTLALHYCKSQLGEFGTVLHGMNEVEYVQEALKVLECTQDLKLKLDEEKCRHILS